MSQVSLHQFTSAGAFTKESAPVLAGAAGGLDWRPRLRQTDGTALRRLNGIADADFTVAGRPLFLPRRRVR